MKLKVVVVDLELTRRQKSVVGAGLALTVALSAGIALAAPKTFVAGETLKATELNASFTDLHDRLASVEGALADAVGESELNLTDPPDAQWQAHATICLNEGVQQSCSVAANRKCFYALGYTAGWYVAEIGSTGDITSRTIACVK